MKTEHESLLTDWFRRARESQFSHYASAAFFARLNYWLGIPTVIFTTAVGTSIFASLETEVTSHVKLLFGFVSVLSAILSALHTFLGFSERAEKHRLTASGYAAVRRELELLKTFPIDKPEDFEKKMEALKSEIDNLAKASPDVPKRIWDNETNVLKTREHKRIYHLVPKST